MVSLRFESRLTRPKDQIWSWIVSVQGIATEMRPIFRMTSPKRVRSLADLDVQPGFRLFRSYLLLFGLLPVDYLDLTLVEFRERHGFAVSSRRGRAGSDARRAL